jgi:signal transduction histidine kinase
LPSLANLHQFHWRLSAPAAPGETRRIERWLATARVFLAIATLVSIWLDPTELGANSGAIPYWLLRIYIAHSVVVMFLLRAPLPPFNVTWVSREVSPAFTLLVHAIDVVWPAVISIYAAGHRSPFFLFFVFVLLAAAYRWGLWETLGTAMAAVALLWGEGLLLHHGLTLAGAVVWEFVPKRLFLRSISLVITGLLLGYLAEQQKQLRAEKVVIARILGKARVESGLSGTLQEIIHELLSTFGARFALMASQEANSLRVFVAEVSQGANATLRWFDPKSSDRNPYLSESAADAFYARRRGSHVEAEGVDKDGMRVRDVPQHVVQQLAERHQFHSVISAGFSFGKEWWGRIFLFDAQVSGDRMEELRFLQELIRHVGPAVYNVYLLRRLRTRAGAVERSRVARELHDGAVQSLIAMEMQVDVARRQMAGDATQVAAELERIQALLREEVLKLRELMQEMKSIDVDARKLPTFVKDTVDRFRRETGINAQFVVDIGPSGVSSRVCREIVRIIQEALVNVRKHSRAKQVLVRLLSHGEEWKLTVEDDGRGFDFAGRFSQAQLDEAHKGPLVIKERVRLIDGQLTIESNPGQGARLEVTIPQNREAAHG